MEDVKQPSEAGMMCTIDGDTFFHSWRIPGLETQVHHAISPTIILACMTWSKLKSPSKVAPVLCLLWKRASYWSRYIKSMELNGSTLYGTWSFAPRQVQTFFLWLANSHREIGLQVTIATTLWSILQTTISSLIPKLRLMMVGLPKLIFFVKKTMKGQNLLQPYPRRISTTFMLNLVINPRSLCKPLLKSLESKSLVPSNMWRMCSG